MREETGDHCFHTFDYQLATPMPTAAPKHYGNKCGKAVEMKERMHGYLLVRAEIQPRVRALHCCAQLPACVMVLFLQTPVLREQGHEQAWFRVKRRGEDGREEGAARSFFSTFLSSPLLAS